MWVQERRYHKRINIKGSTDWQDSTRRACLRAILRVSGSLSAREQSRNTSKGDVSFQIPTWASERSHSTWGRGNVLIADKARERQHQDNSWGSRCPAASSAHCDAVHSPLCCPALTLVNPESGQAPTMTSTVCIVQHSTYVLGSPSASVASALGVPVGL